MTAPAGWYTDPERQEVLRWWDGSAWTEHVQPTPPAALASAAPNVERTLPQKAIDDDIATLVARRDALRRECGDLEAAVLDLREAALLQEVGVYEYSHPLDSSAAFKHVLEDLEARINAAVKGGAAVVGTKKWAINGSTTEGAKMVTEFGKLMLRAYNIEADNIVRTLRPWALEASIKRLDKMRTAISKLGVSMKLEVTAEFHALRVEELRMTADYVTRVAEEKEREREERSRLKEEEVARREYEREQARLEKERSHYQAALMALQAKGDAAAAEAARAKLGEIEGAIRGVIDRAANIRAGYVYVISNIGSFGERMVKIGMTRRLDPMDRVRELGDASVPFRFDVHALIFSEDAVGLETALHQAFGTKRVNLVNAHREFFYVTPGDVKEVLLKLRGDLLTYVDRPEALEWHQSRHGPGHASTPAGVP